MGRTRARGTRPAVLVALVATALISVSCASGDVDPWYSPPATPTFTDVGTDHPYYREIEWVAARGLSIGYADGTFRPDAVLTREAAAIWMYGFTVLLGGPGLPFVAPATATFTDVPTTHPSFAPIEWFVAQGMDAGFTDGTFRPADAVNREQLAVYLYRFARAELDPFGSTPVVARFADVGVGHPAFAAVEWVAGQGIMPPGSGRTFQGTRIVTRMEVAAAVYAHAHRWTPAEQAGVRCLDPSGASPPTAVTGFSLVDPTAVHPWAGWDTVPDEKWPRRSRSNLVDGSTAVLTGVHFAVPGSTRPMVFEDGAGTVGVDLCVVGGSASTDLDHATTTWEAWHSGDGVVTVKTAGLEVVGMALHNGGDGFVFSESFAGPRQQARDWELRGVRVSQMHDDCVQNDHMYRGQIEDSFFDGCFVFYSSRADGWDGGANKVRITNTLVRMRAMPSVPERYRDVPDRSGHGPIFKLPSATMGGVAPKLAIRNTIIRLDEVPITGSGSLLMQTRADGSPAIDHGDCANNVIVWGGHPAGVPSELYDQASYPSHCFTVTTDVGVWDLAVAEWEAAHPW